MEELAELDEAEPEFAWLCHGFPRCDKNDEVTVFQSPVCAFCFRTCLHDERTDREIYLAMDMVH